MLPTQAVSKKQKPAKSFLLWWEGGCVSSSSQKTTKQAQKHECILSSLSVRILEETDVMTTTQTYSCLLVLFTQVILCRSPHHAWPSPPPFHHKQVGTHQPTCSRCLDGLVSGREVTSRSLRRNRGPLSSSLVRTVASVSILQTLGNNNILSKYCVKAASTSQECQLSATARPKRSILFAEDHGLQHQFLYRGKLISPV